MPPSQDAEGMFDVVVIGGGMVGAALACRLQQAGLRIALVEARKPPAYDPQADYDLRVSAVSGSSRDFLNTIGAWEFIRQNRACAFSRMRVWENDPHGELLFSASDVGQENLGYIVENCLITDALWRQLGACKLYCPARISDLSLDSDSACITLEQGQVLQAKLVVAADGGRSPTRELADITTFGWAYQQRGIVAVVATTASHEDTAWQRFLPTGPLAFLPLGDGRCSIVWSVTDDLAEELLALDDADFSRRLSEAASQRLGEVVSTGQRAAFPLQMRQAEAYTKPRLALVGDAAHVIHPLAGQGVNLGFGDARSLAELLIEAKDRGRDPGSYKLLRRYERARKAEDALMAQVTDGLNRLYASDHALARLGRRQGVRAVNLLKPLKTALARHAVGR